MRKAKVYETKTDTKKGTHRQFVPFSYFGLFRPYFVFVPRVNLRNQRMHLEVVAVAWRILARMFFSVTTGKGRGDDQQA